jgi:hypothetical protein
MRLSDYGSVRVTDNECTTPTDSGNGDKSADVSLLRGSEGEAVGEATGFQQLVGRCNSVNGASWRGRQDVPPRAGHCR